MPEAVGRARRLASREGAIISGGIGPTIVLLERHTAWRVVTDPDQLERWYCDAAQIDLRPGGEGLLTWTNRATNKAATVPISVVSVEPPRTFSYRWVHPEGEEARPDNSLLVDFTLTPEGKRTRLRVIESGLDEVQWPDEQKATYADEHIKGWETHIANLRDFVSREAQASAPR